MLISRRPPPIRLTLPKHTLLPSYFTRRYATSNNVEEPHTTSDPKKYAHTLLFPTTSLPQRPKWESLRKEYGEKTMGELYQWQRANNKGEEFVFLDGPPYANGNIHLGHSLNKILKDIINRHQVLLGNRVSFIPGWDCHGLPIENKALKELEADFHTAEPAAIREAAKKLAQRAATSQKEEFELLGVMADWSERGTYRTMDTKYEIEQLKIFQTMVEKGLIYRHHRPSYYSPSSRTALAEAELSYKEDHVSRSVYVAFSLDQPSEELKRVLGDEKDVTLPIWTTTAWSLGSNMAVMANEEIGYLLIRRKEDRKVLIIGDERAEQLEELVGSDYEVLKKFQGSALIGSTYKSLFPSSSRSSSPSIISSSHVKSNYGTGLVHCAPAHGVEDYAAFKASLPSSSVSSFTLRCPIDDDGKFVGIGEGGEDLEGKDILGDGIEAMIQLGRERGWILGEKEVKHSYPYDWKSKKPVIIRATPQWFANIDGIKEQALEALKDVQFVPPNGRKRLESYIESRSEWCISRQRAWGVPIPALFPTSATPLSPTDSASSPTSTPTSIPEASPILTPESLAHILPILASKGTSYWFSAPVEEFLPPSLQNDGKTYVKGTDTMDVWFDSGSAWAQLPERDGGVKPRADVVLEGSDQHRGWFQSLLLTCVGSEVEEGKEKSKVVAPYGTVITHGFVLDEKKEKMSKSDGNVTSPVEIIEGNPKARGVFRSGLGADALRTWVASSDYTSAATVGNDILEHASNRSLRYRRLLKFVMGNIGPETKNIKDISREDLSITDRYVLNELHRYDAAVRKAYASYVFHDVLEQTTLLLNNLSSMYFDCIKDTLYAETKTNESRQVIVSVLQAVLDVVTQSLAPITPYLAEEIYAHRTDINKQDLPSAFSRPWLFPDGSWKDSEAQVEMTHLLSVKTKVEELLQKGRADKTVSVPLEAHLELCVDSSGIADTLTKHKSALATLYSVSHVTILSMPIDEPQSWEYSNSLSTGTDKEAKIDIRIFPSSMEKCPRCWVYSAPREDTLCVRCEGVVRDLEVEKGEREEVKGSDA